MNAYLNYLLEANLGLCFFALVYYVVFRNETAFHIQRLLLLAGIFASLVFPFIHISNEDVILLSLSDVVPVTWLPPFVVDGKDTSSEFDTNVTIWGVIWWTYGIGLLISIGLFFSRLYRIVRLITTIPSYRIGKVQIAETRESRHSFSFFNFIYIGNAEALNPEEKAQVVAHEQVHVKRLHSFDILFLNIIGVFFWFNPVVRLYKKIFVQLHEFEADARAVRTNGVNEYCNLLARVALMSADIPMANHFNQSLTLKRIEMMRTIKHKFRKWKVTFLGATMVGFFFLAACHDQVIDDATDLAKNSSMPVDIPSDVQQTYDALKEKYPDQKLLLVEVDDEGKAKLKEMQDVINSLDQNKITSINLIKPQAKDGEPVRNFMIIQHNEYVSAISERSKSDEVYTIVEESASPVGGMPALFSFLGQNIKYPTKAAQDHVEGIVMIEFIVQADGQITDATVKKGVESSLDAEALRVVQQLPAWNPGKNEGKAVRQKMVLPISFKLSADQKKKTSSLNNLFLPFPLQEHEDKC